MEKAKVMIIITGVFILMFSSGSMTGNIYHSGRSGSEQDTTKSVQKTTKAAQTKAKSTQTGTKAGQTKSKSVQTKSKSTQTGKSTQVKAKPVQSSIKAEPVKKTTYPGTVTIGTQVWAVANLNVGTFRNGDTIPEARTNKDWVTAGESGKPAWCYYNNDPAIGIKYGKLYNWYAVNDPRGLAPEGWVISSDADWGKLAYYSGGQDLAGSKLKSLTGWSDGNNGNNESGFMGLPGGYRVENGTFLNLGSIGTWWSSTESKSSSSIDHYLALNNSVGRSSSPRQRGESVRCLKE